jgi:hypothetical protein
MSYASQLALLLTTWESFELEFATRIRKIVDRHRERLEAITLQFLQIAIERELVNLFWQSSMLVLVENVIIVQELSRRSKG